jgi:hypothetical protein
LAIQRWNQCSLSKEIGDSLSPTRCLSSSFLLDFSPQKKKHKLVEGVEKEERGLETDEDLTHNLSFIHKLDRAENMIESFFT